MLTETDDIEGALNEYLEKLELLAASIFSFSVSARRPMPRRTYVI